MPSHLIVQFNRGHTTSDTALQTSLARSHAAKVGHSRKRLQATAGRHSHEGRLAVVATPFDNPHSQPPTSTERTLTSLRNPQNENSGEQPKLPIRAPHPRTILAESRLDPFNADNTYKLPPVAQEGLEHAYVTLWPRYSPSVQGAALVALVRHWRTSAAHDPLHFHAQVANAMSMCYCLNDDPEVTAVLMRTRLTHMALAMKLIRARLQLGGPASDDLLECIMRLASTGGNLYTGPMVRRYRETPLAEAFPVKLFARFEMAVYSPSFQ